MIKQLNKKDNFNEIISSGNILVDFYADWCGPCQIFSSTIENIKFIEVLKVNVDDYPNIAKEYGVMSIPTSIFFKDGIMFSRKIGIQTEEEIKNEIEKMK